MRDQIEAIVLAAVADLNPSVERPVDESLGAEAAVFGEDGPLSSLELVALVVAVEQAIEDELGVLVVLADERAMSQKSSPFRTVGSLAAYAASLVHEEVG